MKAIQYKIGFVFSLLLIHMASHAQNYCLEAKSFDLVGENNAWIEYNSVLVQTMDGGATWNQYPINGSWYKQNIDFVNSNIGWVVRDNILLKTTNGGADLEVQKDYWAIPGGPGIPFVVDQEVVCVVSDRELLKTTDGGLNWDVIDLNMELTATWFFDADHGMVAGESDGYVCTLKRTNDGGSTWDTETLEGIHEIYNLRFINDDDGYFILAQEPGLYRTGPLCKTGDALKSWDIILQDVASYSVTEDGDVFALVNDEGSLRIMKKGGTQQEWEEILGGLSGMRIVKFLDKNVGWVVGDQQVLKTTDGGNHWAEVTPPDIASFDCMPPRIYMEEKQFNSDHIEAMSNEDGSVYLIRNYRTADLNEIKETAILSSDIKANEIFYLSGPELETGIYWLYAIDESGNISEPVKCSYSVIGELGIFVAKSFDIADKNKVWIEGDNVSLYTNDGGESWGYTPVNGTWYKQFIDFINNQVGWIVRDNTIQWTSNGGETWEEQKEFWEIPYGPGIPFAVSDQVLYVVSDRGLLKSTDGGMNWQYIDLNMELTAAWFFDSDHGIVAGESDSYVCTLMRTSDGGVTWEKETVDGIHEIYNLEFIDDMNGYFILAQEPGLYNTGPLYATEDAMNSRSIILDDVASFSALEDGTVYALVNDESSLRLMKKAGEHEEWKEVLGDLNGMRIVKFLDPNLGWVIGDNQILKTTDGGNSWVDQYKNISVQDSIPPVLSVEAIDQSAAIVEAISTEGGTIYLTPENTDRDLLHIRASAFRSVKAFANTTCSITIPPGDTRYFWLYGTDRTGNVSEPVPLEVVSNRELRRQTQFRLYPNPAVDHLTIEAGVSEPFSVEIIAMNGQLLYSSVVDRGSCRINLSQYRSGIYLFRMRTENNVTIEKVIKR